MRYGPYTQGSSQAQRDELDGYRDALAVLEGRREPHELARAKDAVTAAYRRGVERAVEEIAQREEAA